MLHKEWLSLNSLCNQNELHNRVSLELRSLFTMCETNIQHELDSDTRRYISRLDCSDGDWRPFQYIFTVGWKLGESVLAHDQRFKDYYEYVISWKNRPNEIEFVLLAEGEASWHTEQYLNRNQIFHSKLDLTGVHCPPFWLRNVAV